MRQTRVCASNHSLPRVTSQQCASFTTCTSPMRICSFLATYNFSAVRIVHNLYVGLHQLCMYPNATILACSERDPSYKVPTG
mmetsp:Transcript_32505/g.74521  ORF Transcript_32505/g.74521 Transcript_32505/m.74521 type:complete len:82 (-) Transcript_32505:375-620(-)